MRVNLELQTRAIFRSKPKIKVLQLEVHSEMGLHEATNKTNNAQSGIFDEKVAIYRLNLDLQEKESSVLDQKLSEENPTGMYEDVDSWEYHGELTEEAISRGGKIFSQIGRLELIPARPANSGRKGFYIQDDDVLAFRGIAGHDLAVVWHMLLIPSMHAMRSRVRETDTDPEVPVSLRWFFDLEVKDLPLMYKMKQYSQDFVELNRAYFKHIWQDYDLKGREIEFWLRPENIQLGFHLTPSVGYLHAHLMVGPITEFGNADRHVYNWISIDRVIHVLEQGRPCSSLLVKENS